MTSRPVRSAIAAIASLSMVFTGVVATPAFAQDKQTANSTDSNSDSATLKSNGGYTFVLGPSVFSVIPVKATGFAVGDELSVTVNGKPANFYDMGGSGLPEQTTTIKKLDDTGAAALNVVAKPEDARGGAPVKVVVTKTDNSKTATVTTKVVPKISVGPADTPGVNKIVIGSDVALNIVNIVPGVTISALGTKDTNFLKSPIVVDDTAKVQADGLTVPDEESLVGKDVFITLTAPGASEPMTIPLMHTVVLPKSPLKESNRVTMTSKEIAAGLYQSVYSPSQKALFVTSSQFVGQDLGKIYKVNPETLEIEDTITPHVEGETKTTGAASPFGIAIVDSLNQLWVTNTLGDSVSVYDSKSGKLLKAFPKGSAKHPRAITVDEANKKVYVSQPTDDKAGLAVFDAEKLTQLQELTTGDFSGPMEIAYDKDSNSIYTVGFKKREAAKIDLGSGKTTTYDLGIDGESYRGGGVALDTKRNHLWVAVQVPSTVKVIDLNTGKVVKSMVPGGGPLDMLYDASGDAVIAVNRGSGTATVYDAESFDTIANLNVGVNPNHISTDGMGHVYVLNKPSTDKAARKDSMFKIEVAAKKSEDNPDKPEITEPGHSDINKPLSSKDGKPGKSDSAGKITGNLPSMIALGSLLLVIFGAISYMAQALVLTPFTGPINFPGMR